MTHHLYRAQLMSPFGQPDIYHLLYCLPHSQHDALPAWPNADTALLTGSAICAVGGLWAAADATRTRCCGTCARIAKANGLEVGK